MSEETNKIMSIMNEMEESKTASQFVSLKAKAEIQINKLPKSKRKEWEEKLQAIPKPNNREERKKEKEQMNADDTVTSSATGLLAQQEKEKQNEKQEHDKEKKPQENNQDDVLEAISHHLEGNITNNLEQTGDKKDDSITQQDLEETKKRLKNKAKGKKQRVEDTHTRKTYLVRNDLLERIEKFSNGSHGFKIEFINFAIALGLAEYERIEAEEEEEEETVKQ